MSDYLCPACRLPYGSWEHFARCVNKVSSDSPQAARPGREATVNDPSLPPPNPLSELHAAAPESRATPTSSGASDEGNESGTGAAHA